MSTWKKRTCSNIFALSAKRLRARDSGLASDGPGGFLCDTAAAMRPLLPLSFLSLLALGSLSSRAREPLELELVYLANEGFLVRSGETSLVLDAFVIEPYGGYAALPPELWKRMLAGEPPFAGLDLALTSHVHRDHFQAAAAAEFLRARPEVAFLSSDQVVEDLLETLGESQPGAGSPAEEDLARDLARGLEAFLPQPGQRLTEERRGVTLELVRLPHAGGARNAAVQNLGHILVVGGVRLLHVGDAELGTQDLDQYDLETRAIDVALVPYWWLGDAESLARVRALTGAKHLVAMHVPPREVAEVAAHLAALDPSVLLFDRPGASRVLTLDAR